MKINYYNTYHHRVKYFYLNKTIIRIMNQIIKKMTLYVQSYLKITHNIHFKIDKKLNPISILKRFKKNNIFDQ